MRSGGTGSGAAAGAPKVTCMSAAARDDDCCDPVAFEEAEAEAAATAIAARAVAVAASAATATSVAESKATVAAAAPAAAAATAESPAAAAAAAAATRLAAAHMSGGCELDTHVVGLSIHNAPVEVRRRAAARLCPSSGPTYPPHAVLHTCADSPTVFIYLGMYF